ncbi:MAG TPA: hypothetical protein VFE62_25645, partial [Gemmataceae bacterium]|nr:hypothetical protein [Gemmataceae bacterium]
MKKTFASAYTRKGATVLALGAIGVLALLALGYEVQGQPEKKDDAPAGVAPRANGLMREYFGSARLGYPNDQPIDAKADKNAIRFTALGSKDPVKLKSFPIMGGTVYYAVFENVGTVGDVFGTGMAGFDQQFTSTYGPNDDSPSYHKSGKLSRYLYLYQVVNDRGFDPRNRVAEKNIPVTDDIARFALRIAVDPRYITSWGYFNNRSFTVNVNKDMPLINVAEVDKIRIKEKEEVKPGNNIKAVSFLPSVLSLQNYPAYERFAWGERGREEQFSIGTSNQGIASSMAYSDLKLAAGLADLKDRIMLLSTNVSSDKGPQVGVNPASVLLTYPSREDRVVTTYTEDSTLAILLVDFRNRAGGINLTGIKQGQSSVLFGFTSDLPPAPTNARIDSNEAVVATNNLAFADFFKPSSITDEQTFLARGNAAAMRGDLSAISVTAADREADRVRLVAANDEIRLTQFAAGGARDVVGPRPGAAAATGGA